MGLKLTGVEKITHKQQKIYTYKMFGSGFEYCKKVFSIQNFDKEEITVTFLPERARFNKYKIIETFFEFEEIYKQNNIIRCTFEGGYNNKPLGICVDCDASEIAITCKDDTINEIIQKLS